MDKLADYIEAKIQVQVLARRYSLPLLVLLKRPKVQSFLASLNLKPIGGYIHSEQLEADHWEALREWMFEQMTAKGK